MSLFKDVQRAIISVIVNYHTEQVPFKVSDETIPDTDKDTESIAFVDYAESPIDDLLGQSNPAARDEALLKLIDDACNGNEKHKPLLQYLVYTGLGLLDKLTLITTATTEAEIQIQKDAFKMFISVLNSLLTTSSAQMVLLEKQTVLKLRPLSKTACAPTDSIPDLIRQFLTTFGLTDTVSLSTQMIDLLFYEHIAPKLTEENTVLHNQLKNKEPVPEATTTHVSSSELDKVTPSVSLLSRLIFTGHWGKLNFANQPVRKATDTNSHSAIHTPSSDLGLY